MLLKSWISSKVIPWCLNMRLLKARLNESVDARWIKSFLELHAGLKAFGMQLLKNGLSRRRFASVNWDGLHLKHVEAIYLSGPSTPFIIKELPSISQGIFILTHWLRGHIL